MVLVAGGSHKSSGWLISTEIYDPATGTFTASGNLAQARWLDHGILLENNKVLFAGGSIPGNTQTESAELYDVATGNVSLAGNLNIIRSGSSQILLPNGEVLIAGGFDSSNFLNTAERYSSDTGTYTYTTANMLVPRYLHQATRLNDGSILLTGGLTNGNITLDSAEIYSISNITSSNCNYPLDDSFSNEDTVCVDGKFLWLQPRLFSNLSWHQINAACPGGACRDGAVLNNHNMTGWIWASVQDLNSLFNKYGVEPPLGLERESRIYNDHKSPWADAFVADGWLATSGDPLTGGGRYQFYSGHLSDDLSATIGACGGLLDQKLQNSDEVYTTCNVIKGNSLPRFGAWFYHTKP